MRMRLLNVFIIATCLFTFKIIATPQDSILPPDINTSTANLKEAIIAKGDWKNGENLFLGIHRFQNNGPSCNSCHNVDMNNIISGGALAKDLTQAVSRLSEDGVKGIIAGMPFPQMKQSFEGKDLTESEINDLTAFLVYANDLSLKSDPQKSVASNMIISGVSGVGLLLILFSVFWIRRKQRAVNETIFKRQLKSS